MEDKPSAGVTPTGMSSFAPDPLAYMGALREQADPKEVVERYARSLRGERYDEDTGEWFIPEGVQPLMNKQGLSIIITLLNGHINSVSTLTKTKEEDIGIKMVIFNQKMADILAIKAEEFDIDIAMLDVITDGLENFAEWAAYRSADALWMKLLKSTQRYSEAQVMSQTPQSQKKSIWGRINPFK